MDKRKIRLEICNLLNRCDGCEKVVGKKGMNVNNVCLTGCEIGKEIESLGKTLVTDGEEEITKPRKRGRKPRLDEYLEHKKEGWRDIDIALNFRIGRDMLVRLKKEWGVQMRVRNA